MSPFAVCQHTHTHTKRRHLQLPELPDIHKKQKHFFHNIFQFTCKAAAPSHLLLLLLFIFSNSLSVVVVFVVVLVVVVVVTAVITVMDVDDTVLVVVEVVFSIGFPARILHLCNMMRRCRNKRYVTISTQTMRISWSRLNLRFDIFYASSFWFTPYLATSLAHYLSVVLYSYLISSIIFTFTIWF